MTSHLWWKLPAACALDLSEGIRMQFWEGEVMNHDIDRGESRDEGVQQGNENDIVEIQGE